jgi:hypothetical protein
MAFGSYLRENARDRHTLAIGLFCDAANLPGIVGAAADDPSLFVLSVSRQGQTCYGVYWGLYRTARDARDGMGLVPAALRLPGPVAVPLSRILR